MCTPDRRISLCSLFLIHNLAQELAFVPHAYLVPFSFNHPIKPSVKILLSNCSHFALNPLQFYLSQPHNAISSISPCLIHYSIRLITLCKLINISNTWCLFGSTI
jgi:hypothetical protein